MKILLIAGHGAGDSGATGNGYAEATLTREAKKLLQNDLAGYASVVAYPDSRNYVADNRNGVTQQNFSTFNLVIEIHFNSATAAAHGVEVLFRPDTNKSLAASVANRIAQIGFTNRGAKRRTDLLNMNTAYSKGVPYILIETCFISNSSDMTLYQSKKAAVWQAVANAIISFYGLKKGSSATTPTTKPASSSSKKTTSEIAKEVIAGKWGNGAARKTAIEKAGYNYATIQAEVNRQLGVNSTPATPAKKSIDTIAREVIAGKWGNGATRKKKLEAAGYNYQTIQNRVNQLLR